MRIGRCSFGSISRGGTIAAVAFALGTLSFVCLPVSAQELRAVGQIHSSGPVTSEASKKIVSRLRGLIADLRALAITRENAAPLDAAGRFSSDTLKVDGAGRVQVYVSVSDTSEQALDTLRRHGLDIEIVNKDFGVVQGWIPVASLEALAGESTVLKIRPPSYTTTDTGPVNSQGDAIHRCNQARALGFNGAGIMVGVSSTGVDGLATSQGTGELGAVQVLSAGSGDEGTAMLEIVHDCAPEATLAFASFGSTSLTFMQAISSLKAAGARIIVDDRAAFVTEPVFEDSNTALNDRQVGAAVLRVTSAGNRGQTHYAGAFSPGPFDPQIPGTRHNFGGGDTLLRYTTAAAPTGLAHLLVLQWGNRFGAAADDYDLCVRQTNGTLLGCSAFIQNGNDDPIEVLVFVCTGPPTAICMADVQITLFLGSPQPLRLFCEPSNLCQFDEFNVRSGSVVGHKAVPEVLAVAASPASSPTAVEPYSAAGPATILFPSFQLRSKPDLDGVDCVATSLPGFTTFCGTSAAAPHVAGVAAILMQAMGPAATVQGVTSILKSTAVDLGPSGFDFDFGAGRTDALAAVQAAAAQPRLINISTRGLVETGDDVMIGGFVINGSVPKRVLLRAIGPTLANFGVPGVLANPALQIFSGPTLIAQNDNWQVVDPLCQTTGHTCGTPADIVVTGLAPTSPLESAILITLTPGAYTAIVSGVGGGTGVGLVEVYDLDSALAPSRLINISTRGLVEGGDDVMIGGIVIGGSSPKKVLVRALGPSLGNFGVGGVLPNPFLQIFSGPTPIAENDDWQVTRPLCQNTGHVCGGPIEILATGLGPNNLLESAILITLSPGPYTAIVSGTGNSIGVGLVEVYEVAP